MVDASILKHLRAICLALPDATEGAGWGNPTFRVHERVFAMHHIRDGRPSLWCMVPLGLREAIVDIDPERFFVPRHNTHQAWIGIWLDVDVDWEHVADLVADSYSYAAPKKLAQLLNPDAS